MRFVQALYWLRDMLPSGDGSIRMRLVSILKDADHGQAIQDDLRDGLHALPEWIRVIVRDLVHTGETAFDHQRYICPIPNSYPQQLRQNFSPHALKLKHGES